VNAAGAKSASCPAPSRGIQPAGFIRWNRSRISSSWNVSFPARSSFNRIGQ
jgi:hypothetical protein